jgi:hypothetical protein
MLSRSQQSSCSQHGTPDGVRAVFDAGYKHSTPNGVQSSDSFLIIQLARKTKSGELAT